MFKYKVCSIGGVGSSAILEHIENYNQDAVREQEKRKHTIDPGLLESLGVKRALFLIGDPFNSILSVFSRGKHVVHEISMNYGKKWNTSPDEMAPQLKKETSLEDFLSQKKDLFNLEEHVDNWMAYKGNIEILIAKYEELPNSIDKVMEFMNCKRSFVFKPRKTNWITQPDHIKNGLHFIYGNLKIKIDNMPGLLIKTKRIY